MKEKITYYAGGIAWVMMFVILPVAAEIAAAYLV